MFKRIECGIAGKVFRSKYLKWIKRVAEGYGLTGVVFLKEDGTLDIIAEGEENYLRKFACKMEKGHFWHQIYNFYIKWSDASGEYPDFQIKRSDFPSKGEHSRIH